MNKRPTILVFVDWFVPGTNAGGPIRSVYSMVKLLKNEFDFKIVTRNTDHNSREPYAGIPANEWVRFDEGIDVYYCSADRLDAVLVQHMLDTVDFHRVYINSFYSKWFSVVPLRILRRQKALHKVVLAPRGMLGKGALQIKPLKKKLFIRYAKLLGLHRGITWQASSESEKADIRRVFGRKALVKTAGNLSYIEQLPWKAREKKAGELRLFFLSRLVPIKNLHRAIEALHALHNVSVTYDIYGPAEDAAYVRQCTEAMAGLPPGIRVQFRGLLPNEQVQSVLQQYHALLMPTLNENFGHSILESFCAGCPVIISDQTPWNGLEQKGAGYNISVFSNNAVADMAAAVLALASMPAETYHDASRRAYDYGTAYQSSSANTEAGVRLFS